MENSCHTNGTDRVIPNVSFQFHSKKCQPYKGLHVDYMEDSKLLEILNFLDSKSKDFQSFKSKYDSISSRDVLYFGEFKYRYGAIQHDAKAMPDIMQPIIDKISELYPKAIINSCLITCYQNGRNHCP